jgi:hypothetical protein
MKLFFKNILILLAIIIVCDRLSAFVLQKMFYAQTHGDDATSIATIQNPNADVLILGSSRASHHFISDTIQKISGLKTFNGGRDNMGIHYVAAILPSIVQKHAPKYLILDLIPNNFCKGGQSSQQYFDIHTTTLLPFANKNKSIMQYIASLNNTEALKAKLCATYAYNSLIGAIVQNTYTHLGHISIKGYEPIYTHIDTTSFKKPLFNEDALENTLDTSAFNNLKVVLDICKTNNIKVLITFSPFYFARPVKPIIVAAFENLKLKYNFKLLDYNKDVRFLKNPILFYDEMHLNDEGAKIISKEVSVF